ncbi:MAG: N-6 DNA methylase [Planctomycetia bacterium]|nr:N-6 DNA methylase [Planctomycetia bacterium]
MAKRRAGGETADRESHEEAAGAGRILEEYLSELSAIRATGAAVPETSYYPALSNLFNAIGGTLKPKVRCVINIKNQGAGIPDGGLFTADQFQRQGDGEPKPGQLPARGAIEAKGTKPDVSAIAASDQVKEYVKRYGIVLVTNLREFLIVERGATGLPAPRESFALAEDEKDFWRHKAAHPRATAKLVGGQFAEFIKRACLHNAPLVNPKDVAWFLASYARDALFRVEERKQLPALQTVRSALEEALGMKFTDEKGEHFFRSTLVQTLFYGVFSAWVRWHKDKPGPHARFDWRTAEWSLHVPFIRTLYHQLADPRQLGQLELVEVLDWAAAALNRVDRAEFFKGFEDEHAVQYFYEPFLESYDPELRKELGVWYTPPEIVKYQVARVDRVLREELALPDGLADPNVIVLDPCCGTGAYLVEVLRSIAATLRDKGGDALVASDLKEAAMNRVFGFEIMPAPFVVSHLQLGLMLQTQGAPLSQKKGERVGVYLTNSLTGWEPPKDEKQKVAQFAELDEERDAAERVKREKKILVVLGNPPYNAFAGVSPEEEEGLVEVYKGVYFTEKKKNGKPADTSAVKVKRYKLNDPPSLGGWGIKKFNLDDLYVRFFRLAERRIAEMSGTGVVSFISNFSYLSDPSFVVMRQRFLSEFDKLWFDCMNGDSRETGKLTPEGKPDPSVFSTEHNREGIRVGTAVCVMVRKQTRDRRPTVRFRQFWGVNKRQDLLASLGQSDRRQRGARPTVENRFSFQPEDVAPHYTQWPKIVDFCRAHYNGPVERRAGALIGIDRDLLVVRMQAYFDATVSDAEVTSLYSPLMMTGNRIVGPIARRKLLAEHTFDAAMIVRYPFKVFDVRWAYLANIRPLFSEPSPELLRQRFAGNRFLITRDTADKSPEGPPFYAASVVCDYDSISGHARHFPVMLRPNGPATNGGELFDKTQPHANLSKPARKYLSTLRIKDPDADMGTAGLIWMHALAIGYSPGYLTENADGIRRDWPRIPLPANRKTLETSAALGEEVAALLETESDVPGVTAGKLHALFRTIASMAKTGGGQINQNAGDLAVEAGWGHFGKGGAVMPGKGKVVEREYLEDEAKAIDAEATARGMSPPDARRLLGKTTLDVYLNDAAYWRNIPLNVWEYTIGGYQVIKKWLSYREDKILGRALKPDEAREVMNIARRIAAIILLQPALDENYNNVKSAAFDWPPG